MTISAILLACIVASPVVSQSQDSAATSCEVVPQAIRDSEFKEGTARRQVEEKFGIEGGLNRREHTRYFYKKCQYIQIDIYFKLASPKQSFDFSADDTVVKVSRPYLAYPTID